MGIELLYLFFGWLLGLLGSSVTDRIKVHYERKRFVAAICSELKDLHYRLSVNSLLLGQRFGAIDREYLSWIRSRLERGSDAEPSEAMIKMIDLLLGADEPTYTGLVAHMRAAPSVGLGLKTYSASFFEANLDKVSLLPIEQQASLHAFRNSFGILNQEIIVASDMLKMTYDSSLTDENHRRISDGLVEKYAFIQKICIKTIKAIEQVIAHSESNNSLQARRP